MVFVIIGFSIIGCKKDKNIVEEQVSIAELQGTWLASRFTEKSYDAQNNALVSESGDTYPVNERSVVYDGSEIRFYRNGALRNTYTFVIVEDEIRMKQESEDYILKIRLYADSLHSHTEEYDYQENGIAMKRVREIFYEKK
ncbi:hypothetical protein DI53_3559 [Sphingobacterium deserti]|uniref:Lipocalin-like domain-containing protein n=2 Tax=Sphingobacterium deserti TaxID=1229276 RepID=A0A0B8T536_9SPHI|nr:hypothetical protein DI53_3559 [Sphingobacterium deserti]